MYTCPASLINSTYFRSSLYTYIIIERERCDMKISKFNSPHFIFPIPKLSARSPIRHWCQWPEREVPSHPGGPMSYHRRQGPHPKPWHRQQDRPGHSQLLCQLQNHAKSMTNMIKKNQKICTTECTFAYPKSKQFALTAGRQVICNKAAPHWGRLWGSSIWHFQAVAVAPAAPKSGWRLQTHRGPALALFLQCNITCTVYDNLCICGKQGASCSFSWAKRSTQGLGHPCRGHVTVVVVTTCHANLLCIFQKVEKHPAGVTQSHSPFGCNPKRAKSGALLSIGTLWKKDPQLQKLQLGLQQLKAMIALCDRRIGDNLNVSTPRWGGLPIWVSSWNSSAASSLARSSLAMGFTRRFKKSGDRLPRIGHGVLIGFACRGFWDCQSRLESLSSQWT